MSAFRVAVAVLVALFGNWSAHALPLVKVGSVSIPGFAVVSVVGALVLLAAVVWFMAIRPVYRHPPGSRGVVWA